MVQHHVRSGLRHQRCKTLHQLFRRKRQRRRPVRPRRLQLQQRPTIRQLLQSRTRQRWAGQVPTQPLSALCVSAPYCRPRVDRIPVAGRTPRRQAVRPTSENLMPTGTSTSDRGLARDARGLDQRQRIVRLGLLVWLLPTEPLPREHPLCGLCDLLHQALDVLSRWRAISVEYQPTIGATCIHTVQREDVEVHVEVQRGPEALHDRQRSRAPSDHTPRLCTLPEEATDPTERQPDELTCQVRTTGQQPTTLPRDGHHPLPQAHFRQHPVDPVRSKRRHTPTTAGWAESTPTAAERDEPVMRAGIADQPGKAVGGVATPLEALELAPHESRQVLVGCLDSTTKPRQTSTDDPVEHLPLRPSPDFECDHERCRMQFARHPKARVPWSFR